MITRTENGYALGHWEGIPTLLESGRKLTPGEVRAAVCRANGLTAADAGRELHCSKNTVYQYWQALYFKLDCSDVVVAINKMIEVGALNRLQLLLIVVALFSASVSGSDDVLRPRSRARITARSSRTKRDELCEIGTGPDGLIPSTTYLGTLA
jgi:DNA-binding CsgD family transcriptional regulator